MKKILNVEGMTCSHCENAVKEELKNLPEVLGIKVDLTSGEVEVLGDNLQDQALKEAVNEAGYEVVSID